MLVTYPVINFHEHGEEVVEEENKKIRLCVRIVQAEIANGQLSGFNWVCSRLVKKPRYAPPRK